MRMQSKFKSKFVSKYERGFIAPYPVGPLSSRVPHWVTQGAVLDLDYSANRYFQTGLTPAISNITDFTRSGARTATGSDGVVRGPFATNVRRQVPGDGLRVTAGAVNLLTYSEDFSNAAWSIGSDITATHGVTAPDGSATASRFVKSGATVLAVTQGGVTGTPRKSIWARSPTGQGTKTVGLLGFNSFAKYRLTITEEWQRFEAQGDDAETGGTNFYAVDFRFGTATQVEVWGAQLETGSIATDYIPTTTASASAGADEETFDLGLSGGVWTNLGGLDPSAGFTVLVDAVRAEGSAANANNASLASLRNGSSVTDRIFLYNISGREGVFVEAADVTQAAIDSGVATAAGGQVRMAARIATNNVGVSVNGGSTLSDTSVTLPDFTGMTLNVGAGTGTGLAPVNGFIRRIAIIPRALSDAQLQALTS